MAMWDEDDHMMDDMMSSDDGSYRSFSAFDDDDDDVLGRDYLGDDGTEREQGGCLSLLLGYYFWKWWFK